MKFSPAAILTSMLFLLTTVSGACAAVPGESAGAKKGRSIKVEASSNEHGAGIKVKFEETSKKVACVNPHAACSESEKVIDTLKKIVYAYTEGNFDEFSKYLSDEVTTIDAKSGKVIAGKKAVVADVKARWEVAHGSDKPVLSYTIYHPYAKVTGNTAVVTFRAIKEVGGKKPVKLVSCCTDIFKKEDGIWKKTHYRSDWKKDNKS